MTRALAILLLAVAAGGFCGAGAAAELGHAEGDTAIAPNFGCGLDER